MAAVSPFRLNSKTVRGGEFCALFVAAPAIQYAAFRHVGVFGPIALVVCLGAALLHATPGWRWRELADLRGMRRWTPVLAGFTALTAVVSFGLTWVVLPGNLLALPLHATGLWITIMLAYPFASALGQEVVFRPLFFRRYGDLFSNDITALLANAALFSAAHAFYGNWVAIVLTFFGGLGFGLAYQRSGSFPLVFAMHALAGQIIFTSGLGHFFYHGNAM